jgi:hypothetical protein
VVFACFQMCSRYSRSSSFVHFSKSLSSLNFTTGVTVVHSVLELVLLLVLVDWDSGGVLDLALVVTSADSNSMLESA